MILECFLWFWRCYGWEKSVHFFTFTAYRRIV